MVVCVWFKIIKSLRITPLLLSFFLPFSLSIYFLQPPYLATVCRLALLRCETVLNMPLLLLFDLLHIEKQNHHLLTAA